MHNMLIASFRSLLVSDLDYNTDETLGYGSDAYFEWRSIQESLDFRHWRVEEQMWVSRLEIDHVLMEEFNAQSGF